jgi:putative colanic acid biosynthesis UDP-glucose lipid carrier transferase
MSKDYYQSRFIKLMVLAFDVLIIIISFYLSNWFFGFDPWEAANIFLVLFILVWIVAAQMHQSYKFDQFWPIHSIIQNTVMAIGTHVPIFFLALLIIGVPVIDWYFIFNQYFFTAFLIIHSRLLYKLVYKYIEFSGYHSRKVIVVGTGKSGRALQKFFTRNNNGGYSFLGFFDNFPQEGVKKDLVMGRISDVKSFCKAHDVEEIFFALPNANHELLNDLKNFADANTIYFRIVPDFGNVQTDQFNVFLFDSVPILTTRNEPLGDSVNLTIKRAFDIVFSLAVICLIFPWLFPVIALAIKLDSPGPVLFKQLRCGKRNKLFECYKFRTMRVNDSTEKQASKDDPRITGIGRILRKTSLDEVPQFFNVLLGNMSVVGPRPHAITQLEEYSHLIKKLKIRHFITPGITGWAQVNGYRGETRTPELMAKRVEYDVKYMDNWSLFLDLKIIAKTFWQMLAGDKHAY